MLALALSLVSVLGKKDTVSGPGAGQYRINAMFNRVDGLVNGDDVRVGGVKVGSVTTQRLDANYRAIIGLDISVDVKLPSDSSAAIHTDSLFGSKFVILEPGGEDEMLVSGDMITFTQDAMIVSDLLDQIITQGEQTAKDSALAREKLMAIEKAMGQEGTN